MLVNFHIATLSFVDFTFANLKSARFEYCKVSQVNFNHANLQRAYFSIYNIGHREWTSALSIHDATLDGEENGRDRNLIIDEPGLCNSLISNSWTSDTLTLNLVSLQEYQNRCRFVLHSTPNEATLSQRVPLTPVWNSKLWPFSYALLNGEMGTGVSIELIGITKNGSIRNDISMSEYSLFSKFIFHLTP